MNSLHNKADQQIVCFLSFTTYKEMIVTDQEGMADEKRLESHEDAMNIVHAFAVHVPVPCVGGGRFIARATSGSPCHSCINVLRRFSDVCRVQSKFRQAFLDTCHKYRWPVEQFIAEHDRLLVMVDSILLPLVGVGLVTLNFGMQATMVSVFLLSTVVLRCRRIRLRRSA